jgi:TRAP-type transport system periplasmic protein
MKARQHKLLLMLALAVALMVALISVGCGAASSGTTTTGAETDTTAIGTDTTAVGTDTTGGASGDAKVLHFASINGEEGYDGEAIKTFASELEKRTDGRYTVEVAWASALGNPGEYLDNVANGMIDFATFIPVTAPGQFPYSDLFSLPWVLPDPVIDTDVIRAVTAKGYGMDESMASVKFLDINMGDGDILFTRDKVDSVQNIKGKKIVVGGGDLKAATAEAIGGTPVSFAMSEFYSALQKGVGDAIFQPWVGAHNWKLQEVTKTALETYVASVMCSYIMNQDLFDSMSAEDQKTVEEVAAETLGAMVVDGRAAAKKQAEEAFTAAGGNIVPLSDADKAFLSEKYAPIFTKWIEDMTAKGLPAKEACDAVYNALKAAGVEQPALGYQP